MSALLLATVLLFTAQVDRKMMTGEGWSFLTESGGSHLYMKATERKAGEPYHVVTAYDLDAPRDRDGFAFQSVESVAEYDCGGRRSRVVRETFHEKSGLKGKTWVMPGFVPTDWAEATGSIAEMKLEFACRK